MKTKGGSLVRITLWWIFFGSFTCCFILLFGLYDHARIEQDNLNKSLLQIYSSYSTYLAVLIAFYFNSRRAAKITDPEQQVGTAFWIALTASLIWNSVIVWSVARCWFGGTIGQAIDIISYWGTIFSFLPALFIGLVVANPAVSK